MAWLVGSQTEAAELTVGSAICPVVAILSGQGIGALPAKPPNDDDVVMADAGILGPGFECHGHHTQSARFALASLDLW